MRPRVALIGLVLFSLAGLAAVVVLLKLDNARLRTRVTDAQRNHAGVGRLRAENDRTRQLVAKAQDSDRAVAESVHAEVVRLRAEIERLEKQARVAAAGARDTAAETAAKLATNRDLRRGLVRLENLADGGRGAPDAALAALMRSAFTGDDAGLRAVIGLSDANRAEAQALIGGLPEAARAEWSPERLAALFFTGFFTEVTAAAVESVTQLDLARAMVTLRVTNGVKESTIPLAAVATPEGWRIVPPDEAIAGMRRRMHPAETPAPR